MKVPLLTGVGYVIRRVSGNPALVSRIGANPMRDVFT